MKYYTCITCMLFAGISTIGSVYSETYSESVDKETEVKNTQTPPENEESTRPGTPRSGSPSHNGGKRPMDMGELPSNNMSGHYAGSAGSNPPMDKNDMPLDYAAYLARRSASTTASAKSSGAIQNGAAAVRPAPIDTLGKYTNLDREPSQNTLQ